MPSRTAPAGSLRSLTRNRSRWGSIGSEGSSPSWRRTQSTAGSPSSASTQRDRHRSTRSQGLAKRVEVQAAYAIGVPEPVSIMIDSFGTGVVADAHLEGLVREHFDLTPAGIIKTLDLWRPIYRRTAAYGHFGREEEGFTWEVATKKDDLRKAAETLPRR